MDSQRSSYSDVYPNIPSHWGPPIDPYKASLPQFAERMATAHDFVDVEYVVIKTRQPHSLYTMSALNNLVHSYSVTGHVFSRFQPPAPDQRSEQREASQTSEEPPSHVDSASTAPSQLSDEIFERVPLLSSNTLRKAGMHVSHLLPSPSSMYTSSGAALVPSDVLRRQARFLDQMDDHVIYALNKALWALLRALFIMKDFRKLPAAFSAMHAYQLLRVLLFNRVHVEKNTTTPQLGSFYLRNVSSCQDLVSLMDDFCAYSVIFNILNHHQEPFADNSPLTGNLLDGLRRNASQLPVSIQADFLQHTNGLIQLLQAERYLSSSSIMLRLGPLLQLLQTTKSSSMDSAYSAVLTEPSRTDPRPLVREHDVQLRREHSDAALLARLDPRPRPAPDYDPRRDPRHELRSVPDRRDPRPGDRQPVTKAD